MRKAIVVLSAIFLLNACSSSKSPTANVLDPELLEFSVLVDSAGADAVVPVRITNSFSDGTLVVGGCSVRVAFEGWRAAYTEGLLVLCAGDPVDLAPGSSIDIELDVLADNSVNPGQHRFQVGFYEKGNSNSSGSTFSSPFLIYEN